MEFKVEFILID